MSKRSREASPVEVYKLADNLSLRIRFADQNVDGSLIMFRDRSIFECTHYKQGEDKQFTEPDWLSRYKRDYRANTDGKTDEELHNENEKAKRFSGRLSTVPLSSSALAGRNAYRASPRLELVSFDEGSNILKLKMEIDVPESKYEMGHTRHISMLCQFEEVAAPA